MSLLRFFRTSDVFLVDSEKKSENGRRSPGEMDVKRKGLGKGVKDIYYGGTPDLNYG